MSGPKNPANFWGGGILTVVGIVLVVYGLDIQDTNLSTFVNPGLIAGALVIIGGVGVAFGLITMILGYVRYRP